MMRPLTLTRRNMLLRTASAIVGSGIPRAQDIPRAKPPTYSVDVEVVNVFVSVRDRKGGIVKDLAKEDFTLSEDGRIQTIRYFSRESDLPLTIGLLVDTTPSESNMLDVERKASLAFLNRMLRPGKDNAFLIQYYYEIELLQDLTSSREKLEAALKRLQPHGFADQGGRRSPGPPGGAVAYQTALADAVYLASDEIMKLRQGRKALFILGDGAHVGDRGEEAIIAAQLADTMIYSIRIYDKDFAEGGGALRTLGRVAGVGGRGRGPAGIPPPRPQGGGMDHARGRENLEELSRQTGGAYFEVGKKETLDQIYAKIEEELRSQYNLGYTPDPNASKGYRKIEIGVKREGMTARGREGYYPRAN